MFQSSNARASPGSSALMFLDKNVRMFHDKSAEVFLAKIVKTLQDRFQGRSVNLFLLSPAVSTLSRSVPTSPSKCVSVCLTSSARMCPSRSAAKCQDSSAKTCHGNSAGLCQSSPASRCQSSRARMSAKTSSGAKFATTDKISKDQEQAILRPRTRTAIIRNLCSQSQICGQQENNSF